MQTRWALVNSRGLRFTCYPHQVLKERQRRLKQIAAGTLKP